MRKIKNIVFIGQAALGWLVQFATWTIPGLKTDIKEGLGSWPLAVKVLMTIVVFGVFLWSFPYYWFKRSPQKAN
ncbi:carboxylesterase [Fructobacillus ficulneus]|uniref:Carboxylesterase n=1 Tax=Fructobacillus ficulneus TaxID=157463 RepID=A0A0K8MJI5_9LACO|nr:carboxylesterase [Fructobacillus ficulneus]